MNKRRQPNEEINFTACLLISYTVDLVVLIVKAINTFWSALYD